MFIFKIIAGSAIGTQLAKSAALSRQTISTVAQRTIRYAGIGSISFQTLGCTDEICTIINDLRTKKPISRVFLAQFGAQLFFLVFSVKNYKLTQKLTEVSGSRNPKSIRRILRQHNSGGSFKYLFAGADFMDKNIRGLIANPMMLRSIFGSCLNVAENVKMECEKAFDSRLLTTVTKCSYNLSERPEIAKLLEPLMKILNFNSLDKLMSFTTEFIARSSETYIQMTGQSLSYAFFLKTVYMGIYNQHANGNINDFISSLTEDEFDILAGEFILTGNALSQEFDETFNDEVDIDLGRKIYLVIQARCEHFVNELKRFSSAVEAREELLYEATEIVLKRLTIEAATLFFGLVKSILNECVLQLPMNEAIRIIFQKLVKKFNGDLTAIEKQLKSYLSYNKDEEDKFKREFIDELLSKKVLESRKCSICGGEGFV